MFELPQYSFEEINNTICVNVTQGTLERSVSMSLQAILVEVTDNIFPGID